MKLRLKVLLSLTSFALAAQPMAQAEEKSGISASESVSLTIYNQDFGLVKDIRAVELKDGINYLRFEDVAARIDPTSVSFQSLTAPNSVQVKEQNYQYDIMDPNTILSKSVGKDVKFRQYLPGGQLHELSGILLNSPQVTISDTSGNSIPRYQGLVVKTTNGVILNPQGEVELAELPLGLVSKPSLLWKLDSNKAGQHKTEIAYQASGLNWHCDYVAIANADDSASDLTSWVTLDNKSGGTYKNASLKLLAGDVHRVQDNAPRMYTMMAKAAESQPQFVEQAFAEYHLYTLQGKTDLNDNETKQLSLFSANDIPTKKLFIYEPQPLIYHTYSGDGDTQKVRVKLEMQNSEANHLGMPLPKGKVRVYKKDQDGALQFIGEDNIDHTPKDEKVRLYIGDAFDLVGEHTQTNFVQMSDRVQRISYEISLRNHKASEANITAVEHAQGQWKVLNSSIPFTKKDSKTFEFAAKVPANGQVKITYTIELKS